MAQYLKNGAELILDGTNASSNTTIVMAKTDGYYPFVTWIMDDEGNCYTGHYFENQQEASKDFSARLLS